MIDCFLFWRRSHREPMRLYMEGWTVDMGHKQTLPSVGAMSASLPKGDIGSRNYEYTPQAPEAVNGGAG